MIVVHKLFKSQKTSFVKFTVDFLNFGIIRKENKFSTTIVLVHYYFNIQIIIFCS